MKTYKVDLDYESSLFNPQYQEKAPSNLKIIREFEYVFFLIQKDKCNLKNSKGYEKKYLETLKSIGFVLPELTPNAVEYEYWWGYHHNKEIEKHLNSKLTSAQMAQQKGWGFQEGAIVENRDELKKHLNQFSHREHWIIKRPYSFSGIGHYTFNAKSYDENILSKILTEKILLEPVYERVFDIGTTFVVEKGKIIKQFMVENFNSSSGAFQGGAGASSVDKFKKYIEKKYNYSLEELEKKTIEIAQAYLNLGAISNIQIDSFVYRESGQLKLYALVEVNYRKSMGLVIQSLADKGNRSDWVEWRIGPAKSLKEGHLFSDWTKISPDGNNFHSFFKTFSF